MSAVLMAAFANMEHAKLLTTIVCILGKVYLYIRNICAVKISTSRVCFQLFRDSLLKYEIKNKIILLLYHNSFKTYDQNVAAPILRII